VQTKTDSVIKDMKEESRYVSQTEKDLATKYYSGGYDMDAVLDDPKKLKELYGVYDQFKSYDNETFYTSKYFKDIEKDIVPAAADWNAKIEALPAEKYNELMAYKKSGDYNQYLTVGLSYVPDKRMQGFMDGLYSRGDFHMDKDDFKEYMSTWYGNKIEPKVTTTRSTDLDWYNAQTRRKAIEKKTLWETVALNSTSDDAKNTLSNASKYVLSNGTFDQKAFLKDLSTATGGLTTGEDDKGVFLTHKLGAAEANKPKKTIVANETFTDFAGNTVTYDEYVKLLPTVKEDTRLYGSLIFKKGDIDYSKVPDSHRSLVNHLAANGFKSNTVVEVQTTGYKTRYQGNDGNSLGSEDLVDRPGAINGAKPVTEREAVILVPELEARDYEAWASGTLENKTSTKYVSKPTINTVRNYNLTNFADVNELDADTKQTTVNVSLGQGEGDLGEGAEKTIQTTTVSAGSDTPTQGADTDL
jgi:hypothetical protein